MQKTSAVFIGRFQPLHKGHLYALRYIGERHGKFIVIIGSAQKKDGRNPYSAGMRERMLEAVLKANGLQAKIRILKDYASNSVWVGKMLSLAEGAKVAYSNNTLVKKLCREAGMEVVPVPLHKRYKYYATLIRKRMREGKSWRQLVPKEALEVISS